MNKINKINVCCQKVLPLVYDESLSYYEVLCKVIQKLNELIKINNNIRDEVHSDYLAVLEGAKVATEAVASVTTMRDEVLTLKQATEQYAHDVTTVYNQTVQAKNTAVESATSASRSASTASAKANIAQASATTATEKANIAQQSATTATQKANSAQQSATVATEKANEAKQYANEAKASASLVGQDVIQLKQEVRNLQTSVSENTSDISSLTTKVDNNTSDISSLSTKVDNNTSQITTLHYMLDVYKEKLYPIGSIYISTSSTFNPQTVWGGTWVKTAKGRCLIGANDTYPLGSTGGEERHYLTGNEMPRHSHGIYGVDLRNGSTTLQKPYFSYKDQGQTTSYISGIMGTELTGNGEAHNNMQPYLAVYIWERTA